MKYKWFHLKNLEEFNKIQIKSTRVTIVDNSGYYHTFDTV